LLGNAGHFIEEVSALYASRHFINGLCIDNAPTRRESPGTIQVIQDTPGLSFDKRKLILVLRRKCLENGPNQIGKLCVTTPGKQKVEQADVGTFVVADGAS
jgi:hypothetical protein